MSTHEKRCDKSSFSSMECTCNASTLDSGMDSLTELVDQRMEEYRVMFTALAKLVCPECEHELQHHVGKEGCEIERGDHEGGEGDYGPYPAYAMGGPCGCNVDDLKDDYPDFVRALEAFRLAKGVAL